MDWNTLKSTLAKATPSTPAVKAFRDFVDGNLTADELAERERAKKTSKRRRPSSPQPGGARSDEPHRSSGHHRSGGGSQVSPSGRSSKPGVLVKRAVAQGNHTAGPPQPIGSPTVSKSAEDALAGFKRRIFRPQKDISGLPNSSQPLPTGATPSGTAVVDPGEVQAFADAITDLRLRFPDQADFDRALAEILATWAADTRSG